MSTESPEPECEGILTKLTSNGSIIIDVLKSIENDTAPLDDDTSARLISLYIENEGLYQKHMECLTLKLHDAIKTGKSLAADNENLKLQVQILMGKLDGLDRK